MAEYEGRIPPHSDDSERSVLGAALQSEKALDSACEILEVDDFYKDHHKKIFAVLKKMHRDGIHVDYLTVIEALKKNHELSHAGDAAYIGGLPDAAPSPAGAAQYARIVKDKALLRRLISGATEIEARGYDDRDSAQEVLESAENTIFEISKGTQKRDFSHIKDIVTKNVERINEHYASGKKLLGLSTGFRDLDKITLGLQKQDLIILAARPGEGKTALALNIALNTARKENARVVIFSLEMGELPLGQRLISSISSIELERIRDGSVMGNETDRDKLMEAVDDLGELYISIDESSGITVSEMKSKCKRIEVSEGKIDLIIVDYLQLMEKASNDESATRDENRTLQVAAISRALKQMAKEIDCPVLVLSQMSRDREKRSGRPVLSDLRDSGAIEQDADLVMFIHNYSAKEMKDKENEQDSDFFYNPETMRKILILKHRNGETGDITLSWVKRYTRFGNLDYDSSLSDAADAAGEYEEKEPMPF